MTPVEEAARRLRAYVDAWIAEFGKVGFLPRLGDIPSLSICDLEAVLEDWEGPHQWALVTGSYYGDDDDDYVRVHKTFLHKEEAEAALSLSMVPDVRMARWDENGHKSCWR